MVQTKDVNALFVGIDAGTSVIKAVVFDAKGHELSVAQKSVPVESPKPGYQEMDMEKVWDAAKETVKNVIRAIGDRGVNVKAIGITGQGCGCWLIDREGRPVRNAILWSDSRAADIVNDWVAGGISDDIYKITGCDLFSGGQGAIIKWLSLHEPDSLKKASYALYCKEWIKYKLTGVISTDSSEGVISYVDTRTGTYNPETLRLAGISEFGRLLPEIRPCRETSGVLMPDIAAELGLSAPVPVVNAAYDISASAIGVGAIADGDACSILGTALISEVVIDTPNILPLYVGFTIPLGAPGRWVRMVNTNLGTPNLDWFLNNFCHEDYAQAQQQDINVFSYLEDKISQLPIGSEGLLYNAFISSPGVRAPFLDPNAKAHFIGLTPSHSRHHVLRALFEGIALAIKHSYENIPRKINKLNLCGGGSRSSLWSQIIADCLNTVVRVPGGSEFGAKGAAINAAVAIGYFDSYETAVNHFVRYDREYYPNYENHKKYQELFEVYIQTYSRMKDTWGALAGLAESR